MQSNLPFGRFTQSTLVDGKQAIGDVNILHQSAKCTNWPNLNQKRKKLRNIKILREKRYAKRESLTGMKEGEQDTQSVPFQSVDR